MFEATDFKATEIIASGHTAPVPYLPQADSISIDIFADNASVTGTDIDSIPSFVGTNGVTAVASSEPTIELNALGGKSAIVCDGSQEMTLDTAITEAGEFTRIVYCQVSDLTANTFYIGNDGTNILEGSAVGQFGLRLINAGASDTTLAWPVALNTPVVITVTRNATNKVDVYFDLGTMNRLFSDVAQSGNHTISEFTNRATFRWRGKIFRFIQWSGVELTENERVRAVKTVQEYFS